MSSMTSMFSSTVNSATVRCGPTNSCVLPSPNMTPDSFSSITPRPVWDCHLCQSVGVVERASMGRQSYGSPMGRVWVILSPNGPNTAVHGTGTSTLTDPVLFARFFRWLWKAFSRPKHDRHLGLPVRTAAPDRPPFNHPWPDRQSYGSLHLLKSLFHLPEAPLCHLLVK